MIAGPNTGLAPAHIFPLKALC